MPRTLTVYITGKQTYKKKTPPSTHERTWTRGMHREKSCQSIEVRTKYTQRKRQQRHGWCYTYVRKWIPNARGWPFNQHEWDRQQTRSSVTQSVSRVAAIGGLRLILFYDDIVVIVMPDSLLRTQHYKNNQQQQTNVFCCSFTWPAQLGHHGVYFFFYWLL